MNIPTIYDLACSKFLDCNGVMREARIRRDTNRWLEFEVSSRPFDDGYIAPSLPLEFHCHGMNNQDFSAFLSLNLEAANEDARQEGVHCIASVSLPHQHLTEFITFMQHYNTLKQAGVLSHILGISLEGPLLASIGGTPERGNWAPTKAEWERLATCGELGLLYVILSPDAALPGSRLAGAIGFDHPNIEWIVATLLQAGISPTLGHFQKSNPSASAESIRLVLQVAKRHYNNSFSGMILTDHVFNDMPLKFKHAWRTPEDKALRDQQIKELHIDQWNMDNLDRMLGEVPAELLRAAKAGKAILCINFDGVHVDLEVCRKVVELVGSKSIIAITDSTDVNIMGGQRLLRREGVNLWYQEQGIVAAGTSSLDIQMKNMRSIGLDEGTIWDMVALVPSKVLGRDPMSSSDRGMQIFSYISCNGDRHVIDNSQNMVVQHQPGD